VAALLTAVALAGRRLRVPALGTAAVIVLAAAPWPGAGPALLLTVVCTVVLSAVLIEGIVRAPVPERPHPLLRGAVALPVGLLVVVAALFQPTAATSLAAGPPTLAELRPAPVEVREGSEADGGRQAEVKQPAAASPGQARDGRRSIVRAGPSA
jgi:hypothetical protein